RTSDYASAHPRIVSEVPVNVRDQHMAEQRAYGDHWQGLLDDAQHAGLVDAATDLFLVRLLLFSAMNGLAEWHRPTSDADVRRLANETADLLLDGLISTGGTHR
ncbi:MAG TPA: hypothetical protein PLV68_11200, partial [Ilumatobacteraceae bacterium]|nr:hypothetical protein [Ilumatobacteraceae bacterium]